jgi:hypothetical protein
MKCTVGVSKRDQNVPPSLMAIRVILDIDQQYWNRTDNFAQLGAAAGLVGDILIIPNVEAYTYFETGYRTNVSCATNTTSAFCINPPNETRYEYLPIDYVAIIILPNSNVSDIYTCSYTGINTVNLTVLEYTTAYPLIGFVTEPPLLAVGTVSGNEGNMLGPCNFGCYTQSTCEVLISQPDAMRSYFYTKN